MRSDISSFYKLDIDQRREKINEQHTLPDAQQRALWGEAGLDLTLADQLIENAVGVFALPLGVCLYVQVNGQDVLVPMAIEESSVVAAASNASKMLRAGGGVTAESSAPIMIGQIQLMDVPNLEKAEASIQEHKAQLLEEAGQLAPNLLRRGGGPRDLEVRRLMPMDENDPLGPMLVVHILVDVCDAMGANLINGISEGLTTTLETLTGGRARLRILSNLTDRRTVTVRGRVPFDAFVKRGQDPSVGLATAQGIEEASVFAERDPYRAATHNKGIMNGVDAVLMATGQDYRAIEAGVHAYAAQQGRYTALSRWRVKEDGLHGEMTLPLAVGTVGGITKLHPTVQACLQLMKIERAHQLAEIAAAVGLAQNLAALRALAMEGIQHGHMRLHAHNLALEIGAEGPEIEQVATQMAERNQINRDTARAILAELRSGSR